MMPNYKTRLKETDQRISYLIENNPLLSKDIFKKYKQLLDRRKSKVAEIGGVFADINDDADNQNNELLARLNKELEEIDKEKEKYETDECKEFMRLIMERKKIVKELDLKLNKDNAPQNNDSSSIFSLKASDGNNGRAFEKVTILDNIIKSLDTDWSKNICEKYNLEIIRKSEAVLFVDKDDKTTIEVNKQSVNVKALPENDAKIVDAMIEIYLKGIEGKTSIFSHVVKHQDPIIQQRVERKLVLALKNSGSTNHKVNGKLMSEILNPATSTSNKDAVKSDEIENPASNRVRL